MQVNPINKLIKGLFGEQHFIRNHQSPPDFPYFIENFWGYIKPSIKRRNPHNLDELKRITIEEWNKIPERIINKCEKSYVKILKKKIKLNGEILKPFYLKQTEEEMKKEEENEENFESRFELSNGDNDDKKRFKKTLDENSIHR